MAKIIIMTDNDVVVSTISTNAYKIAGKEYLTKDIFVAIDAAEKSKCTCESDHICDGNRGHNPIGCPDNCPVHGVKK